MLGHTASETSRGTALAAKAVLHPDVANVLPVASLTLYTAQQQQEGLCRSPHPGHQLVIASTPLPFNQDPKIPAT